MRFVVFGVDTGMKQYPCGEKAEEEVESVYSFLAEHLAFMQEIMSVPIEEQPMLFFELPDFPIRIECEKRENNAD